MVIRAQPGQGSCPGPRDSGHTQTEVMRTHTKVKEGSRYVLWQAQTFLHTLMCLNNCDRTSVEAGRVLILYIYEIQFH